MVDQEEVGTHPTRSSFFSNLFASDEFQDLLDGPSTVVALRHMHTSFAAMAYGAYDYLKTEYRFYTPLWNFNSAPDLVSDRDSR
ncbi:MAG TPA: hypothetical protein DD412_02140 [Holosporales bacterium]|nr:hypothetical protein [Holosporales bacterium]